MIGKWIIHGPTREKVIDAAIKTLSEMKISGVESTIELHKKILARPEFRKGELDVKALERWLHEGH